MFVEISKKTFERLKESLDEKGIKYEVSDCTLPGENALMVHVEFADELSPEEKEAINDQIDYIYGADATGRVMTKDKDGDGIPDYLEEAGDVVELRHRKWDDSMHTPTKEALGYLTGASTEEEVTYEHR